MNRERLARMAKIDGSFWLEPEPPRRRHVGQAVAKWIVVTAIAAAAAWVLSDWATAAILDEDFLMAVL